MNNKSEEIWKPIEGYENAYQVSSHGRVLSMAREVVTAKRTQKYKRRLLRFNHGYKEGPTAGLYKNNKQKYYLVSKLVANAFLKKEEDKAYLVHLDFNVQNNQVENLKYLNTKEYKAYLKKKEEIKIIFE